MKIFVTFGQDHVHYVNGKGFNMDTVAGIEGNSYTQCRKIAVEAFGAKFCTDYPDNEETRKMVMKYYPRGIIPLNY